MDEELNNAFDSEGNFDNESENNGKSSISADLIRGHINTIILRTLYENDKYGYEIIDEIEQKSHGQYSLKQPTLYSALKRLEAQGYVTAYWKTDEVSLGGRRKYYKLTESGREITEKNQSEWEYSRTVIDNLISKRSFDFSQPAPTPIDFKILKQTTSRVPIVKEEKDDLNTEEKEKIKNISDSKKEESTQNQVLENQQTKKYDSHVDEQKENTQQTMTDEQKRIAHENYLRLISEQPKNKSSEKSNSYSQQNDDYDYRNVLNKIFNKTIHQETSSASNYNYDSSKKTEQNKVKDCSSEYDDLKVRAEKDGLKLSASGFVISPHKKCYNFGLAILKSSGIVSAILAIEFVLCFCLREILGVALAYPLTVVALCASQFAVCFVVYLLNRNKLSRKPASPVFITPSIIITSVIFVIICLVAFLLQINLNSFKDIVVKILLPTIIALNLPLFTIAYYVFSK